MAADVALVTGGGRGIGRRTAQALAREGRQVAVTARTAPDLERTVELIRQEGGPPALAVAGDVTSPADVADIVATVERELGPIDVLVNNAGVGTPVEAPMAAIDPETWWRVIEVNLHGPALFCRQVVPGMVRRGRGRIVNVNSLAGMDSRGAGFASAYAVSKAGLSRLTNVLAAELRGTGVYVFDVSPGLVRTGMTDGIGAFAGVPAEDWTDIDTAADRLVAVATGAIDELSGRFVHVDDDLEDLSRRAADIVARDARILTLRSYGPDDPLTE